MRETVTAAATSQAYTAPIAPLLLPREWTTRRAVLVLATVFMIAILIVDPWREMMTQDDGWAYARTVKHVLETGRYELDPWSAADMPVQIYIAVALSKLFGYSLSLLRLSTIGLLFAGLLAFYGLLREFGFAAKAAAHLTLGLMGSGLVLVLGFTFMTDVQFLAWLLVALWLYVRALRSGSYGLMFAGSVAAALAIGTRQFGICLLPSLVLACVLARAHDPRWGRLLLTGLALPALVAAWQLKAGTSTPTITQMVRLQEQHVYLSQPLRDLVLQVVWRSATLFQYAGLFLASLIPAVIVASRRSPVTPGATRARYAGAALALAWVLAAPVLAPLVPVIEQASAARPRLMPSLPWLLPILAPQLDRPLRLALSAASLVAGTALAWTLIRALGRMGRLREWDPSMGLVAATGLCLFAMHAIYVQMNDTYVLVFLPFFVLCAGLVIRRSAAAARLLALTGGLSVLAVVVVALGMRGRFNHDEAAWKASDALLARGIQVSQIATIPTWLTYHGDFTEWVSRTFPVSLVDRDERVRRSAGTYHSSFFAWWDGRVKAADYRVYAVASDRFAESATGWAVVAQTPFRDTFLRRRLMIVEERRQVGPR